MGDASRYADYSHRRLPREKRAIRVYGENEDEGKLYRCWNCRAICRTGREVLDTGQYARAGINVLDAAEESPQGTGPWGQPRIAGSQ